MSKPRSWRDFQYSQARREVEALARAIPLAIGDVESPQSGTRRTERTSGGDVSDPTFAAALSRNKVRDDARNWLLALTRLANEAKTRWPQIPRAGEIIDGVKVLEKTPTVEICVECDSPIGANAADPLARIDGLPYHRRPCYQTVWARNSRRQSSGA